MCKSNLVLQFGAGRFLRSFADLFIDQANKSGRGNYEIVICQSTAGERSQLLKSQNGSYHVLVKGILDGNEVSEIHKVDAVKNALTVSDDWEEILKIAESTSLNHIICNTTEKGYELDESDCCEMSPPNSFPARLLNILKIRFESNLPPLSILPCELIENNGDKLKKLVIRQAELWDLEGELIKWLKSSCFFHNCLVDRIASSPKEKPAGLEDDKLTTIADPFALWVIEKHDNAPEFINHPNIRYEYDVSPFSLRKIRILNAAHTALVCKALPMGIETVREAVETNEIRKWLEDLIFNEIVPTLEGRVEKPEWFAKTTFERFLNPNIDHQLEDIALYNEKKIEIRLLSTYKEYIEKFDTEPELLKQLLKDNNALL
ncbi:MAG: mannitol dehydrogenase family protein [Planctomycetota bacterium]|jgi:tagaturonate reductase